MTVFKWYSVVDSSGQVIISGLRLSEARRRVEQLNQSSNGGNYKTREDWEGVPISAVAREHTQPRKR